jgi:hypothetical protein
MTTSSSSRNPRRTALLVGINYLNTANELNGCYNDVVNVAQYLRSTLGYAPASITMLSDGNIGSIFPPSVAPTRQNILDGIAALVAGMVSGDEAFFHYSGHGTLIRDKNGDEASGYDSCICPVDYAAAGLITDDVIRSNLINKVPKGVKLYIILDCCHNGTGCDIRYKYEDYSILLATRPSPLWRTQQKVFLEGKYTNTAGDVYMISGCRDEQTSADAYINNQFAGALTYAVLMVLRNNNIRTYTWSSLLRDLRYFMRVNRYDQIPQIMTGQLITPALAVFSTWATTRGGSVSSIEPTPGSKIVRVIGNESRGIGSDPTLFGFTHKPYVRSIHHLHSIKFLH